MEELKIWCWRRKPGVDLGHVAIQFGEYVYGFYHNDIKGYSPVENKPGLMKKQTEEEVSKDYLISYYDSDIGLEFTPINIINDQWTSVPTPIVYQYIVQIDKEIYTNLNCLFENYHINPPLYHRSVLSEGGNNCVTLLIKSLSDFEIIKIPTVIRPCYLEDKLAEKFKLKMYSSDEKGIITKREIKQLAIDFSYCWGHSEKCVTIC